MKVAHFLFVIALIGHALPLLAAEIEVEHGGLKVVLPDKPTKDTEQIGGDDGQKPAMQHRLIINQPNGSIIVWYQDAPSIDDPTVALRAARDAVVRSARGEVSVDKNVTLQGHPGRYFIVAIPGKGEFRVAYYFARGRTYQIMSVGTQEFTRSASTDKMFESAQFSEPASEQE